MAQQITRRSNIMQDYADDYDKIMLSLKEKYVLHRILKKRKISYDFCSEQQKDIFLKHDLICIQQKQTLTSTGKVIVDGNAPKFIQPTDKATRYFLYRKEDYFKGKLPVVIALIALVISIISLVLQYPF